MTFSTTTYLVGVLLVLLQVAAALPWVAAAFFSRAGLAAWRRRPFSAEALTPPAIVAGLVLVLPAVFHASIHERDALEVCGYFYGVILQVQLLVDAFIAGFAVLLWLWPKGGAIALSAFREGVRQPMFWLIFGAAFVALSVSPFIPYFTFGEDHLMVKDLGYDTIMLAAVVFGALAASMSISEEIEGRTAVTVMSKPVSRRQFLLGKFLGIVLAAAVIFAILGTYFEGVILFQPWWNKFFDIGPPTPPAWLTATLESWALPGEATDLLRGAGMWTNLTLDTAPGLILSFSQVMVLGAIAVSLATRVPMVVNLAAVLVVYMLAHLTPVLVSIGYHAQATDPTSPVSQLLAFVAQLFDTILPDLGSFRIDPVLVNDMPLPPGAFVRYLGSVSLYGLLYTSLVLLFGLILFEDRDLA